MRIFKAAAILIILMGIVSCASEKSNDWLNNPGDTIKTPDVCALMLFPCGSPKSDNN